MLAEGNGRGPEETTSAKKTFEKPPLRERREWNRMFRYANGEDDPWRDERDRRTSSFSWNVVRRFVRYVYPFRYIVALILLCIVVAQALVSVWPMALRWLLDKVLVPALSAGGAAGSAVMEEATYKLLGLAAVLVGLFVVYLTALATQRWLVTWVSRNIVASVRIALHRHMQRMSVRFLEDYRVGRVVSRIMSDTESIREVMFDGVLRVLTSAVRLTIFAGILLYLDWRLTLISCVTLPVFMIGFARLVKRLKPAHKEVREDNARAWAGASEVFSGVRVVKAYNAEKREDRRFATQIHEMMRKGLLIQRSGILAMVTWEGCARLGLILVMCYGGIRVLSGEVTVGDLAAFYALLGMMFQPIAEIVMISVLLQNAMACMERIFEVLDTEPEIKDDSGAVEANNLRGHVEFDHVCFDYGVRDDSNFGDGGPRREAGRKNAGKAEKQVEKTGPTLQNITFTVRPGESVAFVGASGAGKSTLVGLLARFYDVDEGVIRVDGVDLRDYRLRSYRKHLAMVLQENFLFGGSIRENIAYGKPRATNEEIEEAARAAGAWEFIETAEKGLDTPCGERGVKLSGGQKQRLAIARAFLTDPKILILDEATSSLDSQAEAEIQEALDRLMRGRTTFIVAHRLSTIVNVDRIYVMEDGRIEEAGNHEELLLKKGRYYELFMEQYGKTRFSEETVQALQHWRREKKVRRRSEEEGRKERCDEHPAPMPLRVGA